jgi:hypothetical protein
LFRLAALLCEGHGRQYFKEKSPKEKRLVADLASIEREPPRLRIRVRFPSPLHVPLRQSKNSQFARLIQAYLANQALQEIIRSPF